MRRQSATPDLLAERAEAPDRDGRSVIRNVVSLIAGQIATAAVSFGVTAMLARHLGANDYGVFYLAATLVQVAFVLVDFGQEYYVVGSIAKDRARTATLFGTGLVLRLVGAVALYPLLVGLATLLRYSEVTSAAISLTIVFCLVGALGDGVTVMLRGLERMDLEASLRVLAKALVGAAIALAVLADGGLIAVLIAQVFGAVAAAVLYGIALRRVKVARLQFDVSAAMAILAGGLPFVVWAIVVNAQPAIDAVLLSMLAPASVLGWYAASWKLTGILIFPATMMAAALYPTLSRLHAQRSARYGDLMNAALRAAVLVGVLSAAGTYLFADTAVAVIYGPVAFEPAADNLRMLAMYLLLVFVNITLGAAIMAAGAQIRWIIAKLLSVGLATALALALVPLTQGRIGNGGLGCAIATAAAEVLMLIAAIRLVPGDRMQVVRGLAMNVGRGIVGAVAMAASGMLLNLGPIARIVTAVLAYVASIGLLGGIGRQELSLLIGMVRLCSPARFPARPSSSSS